MVKMRNEDNQRMESPIMVSHVDDDVSFLKVDGTVLVYLIAEGLPVVSFLLFQMKLLRHKFVRDI